MQRIVAAEIFNAIRAHCRPTNSVRHYPVPALFIYKQTLQRPHTAAEWKRYYRHIRGHLYLAPLSAGLRLRGASQLGDYLDASEEKRA